MVAVGCPVVVIMVVFVSCLWCVRLVLVDAVILDGDGEGASAVVEVVVVVGNIGSPSTENTKQQL